MDALISGAGIAGPALAYWLDRYGWTTTVVERASTTRDEGQNVDVRGAAREVLRRMGLEETVLAAHTGETGTEFVASDGRVVAAFPAGEGDTAGGTAEAEILRGELSRILREHTPHTEYVLGDRIAAVTEDGEVELASGGGGRYDLVVAADGLRSSTRALLFPGDPVRELGMYVAYLALPRTATDTTQWRWLTAGRRRNVWLRPDNLGSVRAGLAFLSDVRGLAELDRAAQTTILRRTFADVGWETPRILDALDDTPFYFEAVGQTRLPYWSRGRVALAGDAAHCASPISGMSTSLALVGAYVLAGEVSADPGHGLRRYEEVLRPYVERAQKLPPGAPGLLNPRTRVGTAVLRAGLRVASTAVGLGLDRVFSPPADSFALPDYAIRARAW
ncbi:FAD-dependent monooxygenase [Pseudonocardia sp. WMMC193]|uniref:FAD-dependent monooxygenase n=1 Tax=Pseudonocardia sp. WMMC193 TaxID=2911965 RepID=UPI001F029F5D|nr:FAD-dependent monooxygenase [Pseudonocardia sp. WMMC193]MCF7551390.1 FAD-dependent monooxygenase [Pseudonocardia sp. WMMC193]